MSAAPPRGRALLIGNWKMNGLAGELAEVEAVGAALDTGQLDGIACVICPPATLLDRARARAGASLSIGGQDCAASTSGAHTGDLSAEMLRDAGARFVVLGHCERRGAHGEDDAQVRAKAEAARRSGLTAIVCVGETLAERDAGRAEEVVAAQVAGSLPPRAEPGRVALAYEPVWAIGTGRTPEAADIAAMHGQIRRALASALGPGAARVPILYGGSVKPDNAADLIAIAGVDGFLVGGASLKAVDFLAIARAMASVQRGDGLAGIVSDGRSGFRWDGAGPGAVVDIFHAVRRMPYASTGRRSAADLVRDGRGACTAKHLLLRDLLRSVGIPAEIETVWGRFGAGLPFDAPSMSADLREMIRAGGVPDFHHYVTATLDGRAVALDATWHDALIPFGFPVNAGWDGSGDTVVALDGTRLAERPEDIAVFKAAKIAELPQADQESRRRFLGLISDWISGLDENREGDHGKGSLRRN